MAAVVVILILIAAMAVMWLLRRGSGGDRYPDVPSVGRSEVEERRAHEAGLASLADLGGPGAVAGPSAGAKQLDDETRRERG